MRIKCPNCNSIAQIKLVWEDRDSYSTIKTKEYKCSCGCYCEVIFEAKKINILEKRD